MYEVGVVTNDHDLPSNPNLQVLKPMDYALEDFFETQKTIMNDKTITRN
jgi:phosphoribosylformylglycinamidine synthase